MEPAFSRLLLNRHSDLSGKGASISCGQDAHLAIQVWMIYADVANLTSMIKDPNILNCHLLVFVEIFTVRSCINEWLMLILHID